MVEDGFKILQTEQEGGSVIKHFSGEINVIRVPVEKIQANPYQPRKDFEPEALEDLAASIAEYGVLQPLLVARGNDDNFLLIAGERRLRASKMAGLLDVPVIVSSYTEQQIAEIDGPKEALQLPVKAEEGQKRQHEQHAPAEGDAGDLYGIAAPHAHDARETGIKGPHKGRAHGQNVAHGIQGKLRTVEGNEADARHGDDEPQIEAQTEPFLSPQHETGHQGGEHGRCRENDGHVGSHGMGEGDIFQKIIKTDTRKPGGGRSQVTARRHARQGAGTGRIQRTKGHGEAQKQNFHGLEVHKQHLGAHKGDAPYENSEKGQGVTGTYAGNIHDGTRQSLLW